MQTLKLNGNEGEKQGLQRRALTPQAWASEREIICCAGGGHAVQPVVTECVLGIAPLGAIPVKEYAKGERAFPCTAMGALVAWVGGQDPRFVVAYADGNEASTIKNINDALKIRHPTLVPLTKNPRQGLRAIERGRMRRPCCGLP